MQNFNAKHFSNQLTDTEFELLLRHRLQTAFATLPVGTTLIQLIATTDYSTTVLKGAKWHVGSGTSTEGEILSDCVVEANRRSEFVRTNKLLLLEGTAASATDLEDEPTC
jgi:hypothetical protein